MYCALGCPPFAPCSYLEEKKRKEKKRKKKKKKEKKKKKKKFILSFPSTPTHRPIHSPINRKSGVDGEIITHFKTEAKVELSNGVVFSLREKERGGGGGREGEGEEGQ